MSAVPIQGQLDGTIPSTADGQTAEPDKLIDASSVDMSALGGMGGGMGGGFGGQGGFNGGQMPNMPEGLDMETMQQAMQIIRQAVDGKITDEQRTQLHDLGLTDEQIEQFLSMPMGGGFNGRNGG